MDAKIDYLAEIAQTRLPFEPVNLPQAKRLFDIVVGACLLIILCPIIFLICLFYLIEQLLFPRNRGPLIYQETRISKSQPFQIYKFRIFTTKAINEYQQQFGFVQTKALEQEPQNLTHLGKLLKQTYMDELPQLINVLKGEMTLVGPRPSNVVVTWQDGREGRFQRYLFTCGITGPFQVLKGSGESLNQSQIAMQYIQFCRENRGIIVVLNDINILIKTLFTVIRAKGI